MGGNKIKGRDRIGIPPGGRFRTYVNHTKYRRCPNCDEICFAVSQDGYVYKRCGKCKDKLSEVK